MKIILSAQNLLKYFDDPQNPILNKIDLELYQGEFVAVMGPSGSGKSTLLYALTGMDHINDGTVLFEDQPLTDLSDDQLADLRRHKMGFVFQQPTMLANLTLLDNILLPAWQDSSDRQELTRKAQQLMEMTGISGLEQRDITKVSGGQLQRAGICRALMGNPSILFADEPTGALNSKTAEEIMNLFARIHHQGTAILLVTHDVHVAAYADRVIFMKDGQIADQLLFSQEKYPFREDRVKELLKEIQKVEI